MSASKVSAGRVLEVLSSALEARRDRDARVCVRVHVDADCPRAVALAVRDALVAERAGGVVEVRDATDDHGEAPDAVVVLAGRGDCGGLVGSYARAGVPVCVVVEGALDAPEPELPEGARDLVGVLAVSEPADVPARLAGWLAGHAPRAIALAANFPFCRRAVTDELIARSAAENAVVGAVALIPGSDLPIMCANQSKLALDIACAYGRPTDLERVTEVAGVVGAGFAWRALARAALGLVPGLGGLVRAGVGFGGTLACGRALRARLEAQDAPRPRGGMAARPSAAAMPAADGYVTIGGDVA